MAGVLLGEGLHLVRYVGVSDLWPAGAVELVMGGVLTVGCVARDSRPLVVLTLVAGSFVIHRFALAAIEAGFRSRPDRARTRSAACGSGARSRTTSAECGSGPRKLAVSRQSADLVREVAPDPQRAGRMRFSP